MKLSDQSRFPWPVLWAESEDYPNCTFDLIVTPVEDINSGDVALEYSLALTEATILNGIAEGKIQAGLHVISRETLYSALLPVPNLNGAVSLPPGCLRGAVTIRAFCWAIAPLKNFSSVSLEAEYQSVTVDIEPNSIIAITDVVEFDVGSEKFVPWKAIFELAVDPALSFGLFAVDLDGDKIVITCSESTKKVADSFRGTRPGQALMLNGVYLPVLIQVLTELEDGKEEHEGKRWFSVVNAKMEDLGVKVTGEYLKAAQQLFKAPFVDLSRVEARWNKDA
jgi:hypothetical protein